MARIKIKGMPKGNVIKPLWQQNPKTYGLDTTRSFITQKDTEGNVRSQFPEADEEDATIEAEKGERILTPDMENFSIGGKKHSQGGTPIEAEPGSFIFSNDKSLRIKGDILNEFGINPDSKLAKKGFTPAEIAKRYPTNKLLELARSKESGDLEKDTAALSLASMRTKLNRLAFVQESLKGFPTGVPEIGGEDPNAPVEQETMKKGGAVKLKRAQLGELVGGLGTGLPGQRSSAGVVKSTRAGIGIPPYQGLHEWPTRSKKYRKQDWYYDPVTKKWIINATVYSHPKQDRIDVPNPDLTVHPGDVPPDAQDAPVAKTAGAAADQSPKFNPFGDAPNTFQDRNSDTGYGDIDFVNMAAPYMIPLKKYSPIRGHIQNQSVGFNPVDFEAQRQSIKGQVASAQTANNVLAGSGSAASARNAEIFGQSLDPLNQSFMAEFNANQAARMQVNSENAQFRNQTASINAQMDAQYNAQTAATNQSYDDEKRFRLNQFLKGLNNAERNRQVRNAGNVINQDFMVTANGQIVRKASSLDPNRQFARLTSQGGSSQATPGMSFEEFKRTLPEALQNADDKWLYDKWQNAIYATYKGRDAYGNDVTARNPGLITSPYNYGQ